MSIKANNRSPLFHRLLLLQLVELGLGGVTLFAYICQFGMKLSDFFNQSISDFYESAQVRPQRLDDAVVLGAQFIQAVADNERGFGNVLHVPESTSAGFVYAGRLFYSLPNLLGVVMARFEIQRLRPLQFRHLGPGCVGAILCTVEQVCPLCNRASMLGDSHQRHDLNRAAALCPVVGKRSGALTVAIHCRMRRGMVRMHASHKPRHHIRPLQLSHSELNLGLVRHRGGLRASHA
ncbi:hypothetical protein A9C11_10785 [Pseudomonas citronellolis]|uniref:Uncharacterized protein n=1 Tax=Pseudomonas citronellolis TaxID=53408 RepID=A0A1A9KAD6_9PSED|nr:hypothetical protein A9C11_10785 [Pseudomonas citronellolis]